MVTRRGKVVGVYNPSSQMELKCDCEKFTGKRCPNDAVYFVRAVKDDYDSQGNLCQDCYKKLKTQETNDPGLKLEERMI